MQNKSGSVFSGFHSGSFLAEMAVVFPSGDMEAPVLSSNADMLDSCCCVRVL